MNINSSSNNTYIFDPESPTEIARQIHQERYLTNVMGGPLSGITDPASLHTILDLGCGPGGWALDVAFEQPHTRVTGVDISNTMITYANARASAQNLTNVSFCRKDITGPLDLSDASFDLVNARLLMGVLRREAWPAFLAEGYRLLRPGGVIRLTEMVDVVTTSPAFEKQWELFYRFLYLSGYSFSVTGTSIGIATVLPRLLGIAGFTQVRHLTHVQDFSMGSESWMDGYRNQEVLNVTMMPLLVQVGLISQEELDTLNQHVLIERNAEDFCGMGYFHTVLATKPA
jgi:ubiquinone/menaquinone biosynthesis C-methylase UbiE